MDNQTQPEAANAEQKRPRITTAHFYIERLRRRWFGGKQYGKSITTILWEAKLPDDQHEALPAAVLLLEEASRSAPNASAQTRKQWARVMNSRLRALGVSVPKTLNPAQSEA